MHNGVKFLIVIRVFGFSRLRVKSRRCFLINSINRMFYMSYVCICVCIVTWRAQAAPCPLPEILPVKPAAEEYIMEYIIEYIRDDIR